MALVLPLHENLGKDKHVAVSYTHLDVYKRQPINKHTIQSEEFSFPGHTEYIEEKLGNGGKALMLSLIHISRRIRLITIIRKNCGSLWEMYMCKI